MHSLFYDQGQFLQMCLCQIPFDKINCCGVFIHHKTTVYTALKRYIELINDKDSIRNNDGDIV